MSSVKIKTSENSPIRVDFVAGRPLGLTFAPGKHGPSLMNEIMWERNLDTDLDRLKDHYAVACLVTLIEEHEMQQLKIPGLRDAVRAHQMTSHWFPIVDGGVPEDLAEFVATVRTIRSSMNTGNRVVLHCRGGLGRAGTVAACVLVSFGETADEAILKVRDARHGAIENARQEAFVDRFEQFWTPPAT